MIDGVRMRRVFGAGIIAGLMALSFAVPATAESKTFSSWFKYLGKVANEWDIVGDPENPLIVSVRPKGELKSAVKRVLVLYPRASSAYDIAISKVLNVFASKELNVHFTVINYQLKDPAAKEAIKFAEDNKFDLIFSMGSESTASLYEQYLGGALPVVTICSKDPVQLGQMKGYETGSGTNFAYTSLNMPVEVQMAYIMNLKPNLKNLAILVDSKNVSAVQTQADPIAAQARKAGLNVMMDPVTSPAKAREELAHIVPDEVRAMRKADPDLTNSVFLITGSTSVFKEIRTINQGADRVPVLSMIPEIVTAGKDTAVIGMGISFESNAHLAAIYGADILSGKAKVGDLKVGVVSPPDIAISFLKAREIGMSVPFSFFETATFVYDYAGQPVRMSRSE